MQILAKRLLTSPIYSHHWLDVIDSPHTRHILITTCTHLHTNALQESTKPKDAKYIDRLVINVQAGKGGNGSATFWRGRAKIKHLTADGGNGGDGGSIIIRASSRFRTLASLQKSYKAESGGHGMKLTRQGKNGKDTVITVPLGTTVYTLTTIHNNEKEQGDEEGDVDKINHSELNSRDYALVKKMQRWRNRPWIGSQDYDIEEEEEEHGGGGGHHTTTSPSTSPLLLSVKESSLRKQIELADLVKDGQEVLVARGGKGGLGNAALVPSLPHRPAPSEAETGEPGEAMKLLLEMKHIADIGLVGLPNVGKSSLLRSMSAAHPRVADYPFTTLSPQLGSVSLHHYHGDNDDGSDKDVPTTSYLSIEKCIVADVPGLVEGAHANRGLGHKFLKHIERTKVLGFVVDLSRTLDNTADTSSSSSSSSRQKKKNKEEEEEEEEGLLGASPAKQLELLRREVGLYSEKLLELPWMVIGNKVDMFPDDAGGRRKKANVIKELEKMANGVPVITVSAVQQTGLNRLRSVMHKLMSDTVKID